MSESVSSLPVNVWFMIKQLIKAQFLSKLFHLMRTRKDIVHDVGCQGLTEEEDSLSTIFSPCKITISCCH